MREKLAYILSMFDFCLGEGMEPLEAWEEALRAYAFVYHTDDSRPPIARSAEIMIERLKAKEEG